MRTVTENLGPGDCCKVASCEDLSNYFKSQETRPPSLTLSVAGGCLDGSSVTYNLSQVIVEEQGYDFFMQYVAVPPVPAIPLEGEDCPDDPVDFGGFLTIEIWRNSNSSTCNIRYFYSLWYSIDNHPYTVDVFYAGPWPEVQLPIKLDDPTHEYVSGQGSSGLRPPCVYDCEGNPITVSITE